MLLGKTSMTKHDILPSINFDNVTIKLEDMMGYFRTYTKSNGTTSIDDSTLDEWYGGSEDNVLFYLSYQDPTQICYTRNATHYPKMRWRKDEVIMKYDLSSLLGEDGDLQRKLNVHIHSPGQLLNALGEEVT